MNRWLWVSVSIVAFLVLRSLLARLGYGCRVAVIFSRPRRNPRLPTPKPGNVVIPLQIAQSFEKPLREGFVGIVRMESVGDGTVTLVVEQQQPQGS